jgi:hypothetical protein
VRAGATWKSTAARGMSSLQQQQQQKQQEAFSLENNRCGCAAGATGIRVLGPHLPAEPTAARA